MARRKEAPISDHLLDQLLAGADAQSAFASDGLLNELKKALAERALNAEMEHDLDQDSETGNTRKGYDRK
jgi:putative transposase